MLDFPNNKAFQGFNVPLSNIIVNYIIYNAFTLYMVYNVPLGVVHSFIM